MKRFRPRLTYANVIASLALFVALGGSAVAAGLAKNSVGPKQLKKGAVTAPKLAKQAVVSGKIAPKAVTAGKLGPNAVLPGNLGAGIIDGSKIAASAVTAEKIKNNVVTTNKITNAAVTSQKLAASAVASGNIATGAVTKEKIAAGVLGNVENLKTSQTERGVFNLGGTKAEGDEASAFGAVSFQQILAANPASVQVVQKGATIPGVCAGLGAGNTTPEAAAGVVCLYLTTETNLEGVGPAAVTAQGSRLGVTLAAKGLKTGKGEFVASGVWAVTAP
ncbi:MAG TPA: hypothetical protein VMF55_11115 [Solirubrobacterales bacterium]|nr:hypothetical protein [Solirubrobacterales bacterium]